MYCNYEQNDWADLLDTAAFVYNNTVHNSIGVSPFFACYGWNPKAHPDIPQRLGVNDPDQFKYLINGKERCKYLQEQIREAQRRTADQYNRKRKDIKFKVGDMVYINHRNWKTRRPSPKLDTWFAGPYLVQERVGRQAYRITLPANLRVHDVFHVSMLEPAKIGSLSGVARLRPGSGGSTGAILVSSNRLATIKLCDSYRLVRQQLGGVGMKDVVMTRS
ncbi:uncharacterized protein UDID_19193 [Ustilago sp. UG-2017a]|nr:uncharacterized protein UDID_19193 [Ustilago sp. UG-2017a]